MHLIGRFQFGFGYPPDFRWRHDDGPWRRTQVLWWFMLEHKV